MPTASMSASHRVLRPAAGASPISARALPQMSWHPARPALKSMIRSGTTSRPEGESKLRSDGIHEARRNSKIRHREENCDAAIQKNSDANRPWIASLVARNDDSIILLERDCRTLWMKSDRTRFLFEIASFIAKNRSPSRVRGSRLFRTMLERRSSSQ